jgi:predicted transcriptional regulator YdeE
MKIEIKKSCFISSSQKKVYDVVSDLSQWDIWSPWMKMEPKNKNEIQGHAGQIGQSQTWDGEVIGSGKMTILKLEPNKQVEIDLQFYKPWKSTASVFFELNQIKDDETEVIWKMETSIPFFLFFMKKSMTAFMGSDFERGLLMLKDYCETKKVVSDSKYIGEKKFRGFQIVGKTRVCEISNLSELMEKDFKDLSHFIEKGELAPPEKATTLYHKFDIPNGVCEYTAGFFYSSETAVKKPAELSVKQFNDHQALQVEHWGPYKFLSNAWSMVMAHQRVKKKKASHHVPMYEHYITMPDGRPESEIKTEIYFPVR